MLRPDWPVTPAADDVNHGRSCFSFICYMFIFTWGLVNRRKPNKSSPGVHSTHSNNHPVPPNHPLKHTHGHAVPNLILFEA